DPEEEEDEEDPEEDPAYYPADIGDDDEEDPEEDPAYYPADIGDDDEEDEEEEHLASANSIVVALPAVDRIDSIFFISYSPFPQTPSPPPPQILSPPISPTHIEIPESCLPPRKRTRLASPTPIYEVGETSAAGAARHDIPAIPREDPYVVAREDLYYNTLCFQVFDDVDKSTMYLLYCVICFKS
ncbi:hypothetical protein Tco_0082270, partial [Tanacetum coccineum]